jgi:hypothetical protein
MYGGLYEDLPPPVIGSEESQSSKANNDAQNAQKTEKKSTLSGK